MMSNKPHLLIVDKDKDALSSMQEILAGSYTIACAETGAQAVEYATKICPDLILLNNSLPDCDAEKVMEEIDEREDKKQIPFIIIMDSVDYDSEVYVLPSRAMDFIVKPVIPAILQARVERVLEVQVLHQNLEGEIEKQKEQISRLSLQSVVTIAQTIDARDRYAKGHSIRVALFCREIAAKLGWDEKDIDDLYYTALLHDIGKIAVEDAILNKSSELTGEEFEQIKKHTVIGGEMVKNISFIPGVVNGVRYHHERYDGTGYARVSGDKIPVVARIIAVADAYAAMTSDRAFRKRKTKEEAREELVQGRGSQFDPLIVDAFLELLDEGLSIDEENLEEAFSDEEAIGETGDLLRQIFNETVQEAQSERERDSLTGFLNRRYFEEKVNVFLQKPKASGTFFMMDLDDFKNVNDVYGHVIGDQLILAFAEVLRMNTREGDYVCRIGGDEFAIFFPELDKERVICNRAENIIHMFSEKKKELGCELCSVSIGIMTKYPGQKATDCTTMYNNADKALYYVKNNGKDDYHMYANIPEEERNAGINIKQMDLKQLMRKIAERKYHQGAYAVEYDRFAYIFQFVARNVERSKQQVQIILFSIRPKQEREMQEEEIEDALMLLETAIIRSLRRGDVTTRLSATQQIVILMDTNMDNGKIVANRIVDKYKGLAMDQEIEITYDITDVPVKKAE